MLCPALGHCRDCVFVGDECKGAGILAIFLLPSLAKNVEIWQTF